MKAPGEILLVSCYELGHQPLGLASPAGFLARAGYSPAALDLAVQVLDEDAIRRARIVAISVPMHTALRIGVRVAERVRALSPSVHICCFGLYAPLHGRFLRSHGVDSVLGGEYEEELVRLCDRLAAGDAPANGLQAVRLERLDFARPERAALPPLRSYAKVVREDGSEQVAGYTEASRGCLHHCRHCPIPPLYDGRFFIVPVAVVLADVRAQVAAGATHITLGDPDFLNGPGHALAIARAIHGEFPSLTFDITAKVEHLIRHRALLPELASLGCLFIVSAVESLSERVLAILDKGHTRADVVTALTATRAAGIALRPSLVPFTPWSTLDDFHDLIGFAWEHDLVDALDPVQLAIRLLVPPGSLLEAHPEMRPHLGVLDEAALTWRWTHPDPRMDALQRAVHATVADAALAKEDPRTTFAAIARLAARAAGRSDAPPLETETPRPRRRVPRLTEPWFC
ncbi:MAG: radical SAM protein [Myxococcales bacterium]|nr:radical SAM protein [Myxococcales bacterium]